MIVDDDRDLAESLADLLIAQGYENRIADRAAAAIDAVAHEDVAVAMLDIRLGITSGMDLLSRLKIERPDLICIMMTAHGDTQTAIEVLRATIPTPRRAQSRNPVDRPAHAATLIW